eukprot:484054_1
MSQTIPTEIEPVPQPLPSAPSNAQKEKVDDATETKSDTPSEPTEKAMDNEPVADTIPNIESNNNDEATESNPNDITDTKPQQSNDDQAVDTDPPRPIEISQQEQDIYNQLKTEKETITKSMDRMMQSLASFETDSQQKTNTIHETFDALTKALNDRKIALLNDLNNDILTHKSNALTQIESLKQYDQTLTEMDAKYETLTHATADDDDQKVDTEQRKTEILNMAKQFDSTYSTMDVAVDIKLIFDTKELRSMIDNFGSVLVGKADDLDYDGSDVPSFIDSNLDLLLAEIPVKRLYRWIVKSDDEHTWESRTQRSVILFYQNKKSYKVRMIVREKESDSDCFLMNQWVSKKELVEKETLAWIWSGYDATIATEEGDKKKGYSKWCGKFFDQVAFERFEEQYNQARKINVQVLNNEEQMRKNELKKEKLEAISMMNEEEEDEYYENDERLCFEMNIYQAYLWGKDASGKGAWISYAKKSLLQFFENRKNTKIRIVVRENESKELKLNHWIPTDVTLKSRGDQMWEWEVYDELATQFLKTSTLKLATICGTFLDAKDTEKFEQLFEKYQKINQKAV